MLTRITSWIKKGRRPFIIIFTVLGGAGGYLYWHYIGCNTGTCPIRSVWYYSTLYGLVLGYLAGDIISGFLFRKKKKEEEQDKSG